MAPTTSKTCSNHNIIHSTMAKISLLALIAVVSSPLYTTAFAPSSSASSFSLQRPGTASSSPLFNTQFDPKLTTTSPSHERRSTTARMMAPAAASATATGASALMGVVSGGILGGALHAIAGKFVLSIAQYQQFQLVKSLKIKIWIELGREIM